MTLFVRKSFKLLTFSLIVTAFLTSCSSARKVVKPSLKDENADMLFQKMKENQLKFDWLSAKFSTDYINDGKENSFNGQIRIRKDSVIWISITPLLGIEALRLMITRDSVKLINRLNDTYFTGDYNYINRFLKTNIDFDLLQAVLLGIDPEHYETDKFIAKADNGYYKLSAVSRSKLKKFSRKADENLKIFAQDIWLDPVSFKITREMINEIHREDTRLEANYKKFEPTDNQLFPAKSSFLIHSDHTIQVNIEFSRITINSPQSFPFKIPSGYSPLN